MPPPLPPTPQRPAYVRPSVSPLLSFRLVKKGLRKFKIKRSPLGDAGPGVVVRRAGRGREEGGLGESTRGGKGPQARTVWNPAATAWHTAAGGS